jgi:hypothetical protein
MGLGKKIERPKATIQSQDTGSFIRPTVQSKLQMGSSGDKYEKQADNVADRVVQKKGNEEEPVQMMSQEEEAPVQKMEEEEPVQKMSEEEPVQKMGKDEESM